MLCCMSFPAAVYRFVSFDGTLSFKNCVCSVAARATLTHCMHSGASKLLPTAETTTHWGCPGAPRAPHP